MLTPPARRACLIPTSDPAQPKLVGERGDPECDVRDHNRTAPRIVCTLGRGWLSGWPAIGAYCGFPGPHAGTVGRKWERELGFPVHRLPGTRQVKAIPYELDQWLMNFTRIAKDVERRTHGEAPGGHHPTRDWRTGRSERP